MNTHTQTRYCTCTGLPFDISYLMDIGFWTILLLNLFVPSFSVPLNSTDSGACHVDCDMEPIGTPSPP
jgi:hypothetical protein